MLSVLCFACLSVLIFTRASAAPPPQPIEVSLNALWTGQTQAVSPTDPIVKLMKADPTIRVKEWSGLSLPGVGVRTPLMMSIAGNIAPDLYLSWFHVIRNDISQGFAYPLNEWVGHDANGNGQIDPSEAKWKRWEDFPPLWRQVATVDGKVYGVPVASTTHYAIVYRTDLVRQAGLDPDNPPRTWEEFFYWGQRLTDPGKRIPGAPTQRGQRAFAILSASWLWLPWLSSADGNVVEQVRTSPTTGVPYHFPMDATRFVAPDTGEDLTGVPSEWRATLASDEVKRTVAFYHRLRWQRWLRDPKTGEPVNLTNAQAAAGAVTLPNGRVLTFTQQDVITGIVRPVTGQFGEDSGQWFSRGEVAMMLGPFDDLTAFASQVNPDLLGVFAIPAGPGAKPVVQTYRHYVSMTEGVGNRPPRERDAVWKVLNTLASPDVYDENLRRMILAGHGRFISPRDLDRLGFHDYVRDVPPSLKRLYAQMDSGQVKSTTEPFMGFWVSMDMAVNTNVLSLVLSESGDTFDYVSALKALDRTANSGIMFSRKPKELAPYRPLAWTIFGVVALMMGFFLVMIIRTNLAAQMKPETARTSSYKKWAAWLLLFPALGLVALWGYYPLFRGMVMAFQDYHIVGKSPWVGLDNFINIFLNPDFYIYIRQTLKFVFLSLLLVFTAPILLSLLLAEIPRGKVFWRSIFFLPQLTSGLVIVLLWKLMYSPTDSGLINQIISFFGLKPQDWLGNASTAMVATIIPTVWAGTGMASLIYLAALKGIPDELYEAAALDGAGLFSKLRFVTFPQLMPLLIINFVGAFIGTFQGMGNIFLLTFGGPGKETMVMSMAIWIEAYTNLRFSVATAMAWILGSALIGFAYLQIRILRKVEFRRVEEI